MFLSLCYEGNQYHACYKEMQQIQYWQHTQQPLVVPLVHFSDLTWGKDSNKRQCLSSIIRPQWKLAKKMQRAQNLQISVCILIDWLKLSLKRATCLFSSQGHSTPVTVEHLLWTVDGFQSLDNLQKNKTQTWIVFSNLSFLFKIFERQTWFNHLIIYYLPWSLCMISKLLVLIILRTH